MNYNTWPKNQNSLNPQWVEYKQISISTEVFSEADITRALMPQSDDLVAEW